MGFLSMLLSKAWSVLRNYEARDLVLERLRQRHGEPASTDLAREISCAFVQGREYFYNAKRADVIVKPLLLYYGVKSLARGAIQFLSNIQEEKLTPSHGICPIDWKNVLSDTHPDPSKLVAKIQKKGTLPEFMTATKNKTLMRLAGPRLRGQWCHHCVAKTFELTLGQLLARLPDVAQQYVRWKGCPSVFAASLQKTDEHKNIMISIYDYQFEKQFKISQLNEMLEKQNFNIVSKDISESCITVVVDGAQELCVWDMYYDNLNEGITCIVAPFDADVNLSKPTVTYILAYFIGMVARYFPTFWISMARHERNDAAFPTLLEALSYVERRFPLMVSDSLESDERLRSLF